MALSTQYDSLFRRYGGSIPVAYLRALAQKESGMNPRSNAGQAKAQGLLQITTVARDAFNQRHGTSYDRDALLEPGLNIQMATELLRNIITAYGKRPGANFREDWSNPEWVKLLTAGWNAGYSSSGGVGKVAIWLEGRGQPVSHDSVVANAAAAGAVSYLADPLRARWHRGVSELYFAQPDRPRGGLPLAGLALALVVGWGAYRLMN